jgi:membrane-associated phospholipid phosphatase
MLRVMPLFLASPVHLLAATAQAQPHPSSPPATPPAAAAASSVDPGAPTDSSGSEKKADRRLRWPDDRPRFRIVEYVAAGVVGGAAIWMYFGLRPQAQPHWIGGILFDDAVRNTLRLRTAAAQQTAWAFSDAVDVGLVVLVFGLDSLALPILRGSPDVALQLGLMDAEAYAFSSVVAIGLYDSVGRARPSYEDCQHDPSFAGCRISPTASFPSGHTNEAFTAAGVSCANHGFLPIYGSRVWDALACARDLFLATSDGVLRIMGDRHYATDVLTGGAIGFGFGYGMPTLLHYTAHKSSFLATLTVSPLAGHQAGLAVSGLF